MRTFKRGGAQPRDIENTVAQKRGNKHTLTKLQAVYLYTYWPACTGRISSLLSLYYLLVVA